MADPSPAAAAAAAAASDPLHPTLGDAMEEVTRQLKMAAGPFPSLPLSCDPCCRDLIFSCSNASILIC